MTKEELAEELASLVGMPAESLLAMAEGLGAGSDEGDEIAIAFLEGSIQAEEWERRNAGRSQQEIMDDDKNWN